MRRTLSQFHGEQIYLSSFFHGVGIFLLTFCISMALGVVFGLACSLMLKHSELGASSPFLAPRSGPMDRSEMFSCRWTRTDPLLVPPAGRYTEIEACLVLLIAYTSYFFSNALTMSGASPPFPLVHPREPDPDPRSLATGIVSLLFCGITLKHYAYHNMSHRTQRTTRYVFGSLSSLSENFIFIYLGLSLFTQSQLVYKPMFIIVTCVRPPLPHPCSVLERDSS